jgi:hypothetical protein
MTKDELELEQLRRNIRFGGIARFSTVIGFVIAMLTYLSTWYLDQERRAEDRGAAIRASRQSYLNEQLDAYKGLAQVCHRLTVERGDGQMNPRDEKALKDTLGELRLFADYDVVEAVQKFQFAVVKPHKLPYGAILLQETALNRELDRSIEEGEGFSNAEIAELDTSKDVIPLVIHDKQNQNTIVVRETDYVPRDYFAVEGEAYQYCGAGHVDWIDFTQRKGINWVPFPPSSANYGSTTTGAYTCSDEPISKDIFNSQQDPHTPAWFAPLVVLMNRVRHAVGRPAFGNP